MLTLCGDQKWFEEVGYSADIAKCREMHPPMKTLEMWVRENKEAFEQQVEASSKCVVL